MKMWKKFVTVICSLSLIFMMSTSAFAGQSYTYKVTLSAGAKGSFSGNSTIELDGISYDANDRINLTSYISQVQVSDEKYYVKGFHISGQEGLVASVPKTSDAVYVVTYGVLGNSVAYTINYQDADGNTLAPSETFYGNVGDKPVVAFLYIDGYQPQAYNLTKTLSDNEAENVFTFTYAQVASAGTGAGTAGTGGTATGTDANAAGTAAGTGADANAAGTTTGAGAGTNAAGGNAGGTTNADGTVTNADGTVTDADGNVVTSEDEETPLGQPEDTVDLDDEETPLGNIGDGLAEDSGATATMSSIPVALKVGIGVVIAAIVAYVLIYTLTKRKKAKK